MSRNAATQTHLQYRVGGPFPDALKAPKSHQHSVTRRSLQVSSRRMSYRCHSRGTPHRPRTRAGTPGVWGLIPLFFCSCAHSLPALVWRHHQITSGSSWSPIILGFSPSFVASGCVTSRRRAVSPSSLCLWTYFVEHLRNTSLLVKAP